VSIPPYDALLLVSFGGPEGPEDVLPFLENVTRGRGIPRERLAEVGQHYRRFGGVSPINAQNRALLEAIEADLAANGLDLPVYWGNRNWDPYLADAMRRMREDGVRRAVCFVTAAYASYSGCRQYRENLAGALEETGEGAPRLDKLRHYFNHPGFLGPMVESTLAALGALPEPAREGARLAFVTHSIPTGMDDSSGPSGSAYSRQHLDVAATVAGEVAARTGVEREFALVYCSRSGPPSQPWLEPDVNDHLESLSAAGAPGVVIVPIGFISDHMEVIFDLDTEAMETAERLRLPAVRAATVGTHPAFVAMVRELVRERAAAELAGAVVVGEAAPGNVQVVRRAVGRLGPSHDVCPVGCCPNPRGARPAACGADA
jgi:ferrochelatase